MNKPATIALPVGLMMTRKATIAPASFNAADNSFEAVWTTGATVRRSDWIDGEYDETLATNPENVRLDRLNAGGPLLANHDRNDLAAVVGSIIPGSVVMNAGMGIARIRLAETPDVADIVAKVMAGHIRNISAGYIIHAYEVREGGMRREILVTDWEPVELSLVSVPADAGAAIRSEGNHMSYQVPGAVNVRHITQAAARAGLNAAAVDDLVQRHEQSPFTHQALMAEIGRAFAARDSSSQTVSRAPLYPTSQAIGLRDRMADALYARMNNSAPSEQAREFMGASLPNMARGLLEAAGERAAWLSDAAVIERAMHTTSDFPVLLQQAGNRFLLSAFEAAESALKAVAREREAPDFRDITVAKLSGMGRLDRVNESGEVTYGSLTEGAERYKLSTFAKIFSLSRQSIINDDLGAFTDPLRIMARAAAETEAQELAALLLANSGNGVTLADGQPLYHSSHANRAATGTAGLTVAVLGAGRQAMREQKDLDGKTLVNAAPKFLVVGPALETQAEQMLTDIGATVASDVNPFPSKLTLVVDPRLTGNSWRLFADPALFPVVEYAYLSSEKGPQLLSRDGWNSMGTEFRVHLDFGCGVVDHRGTYMNPGA